MVLVFLPALDGVRPQWREATASLGGTTWHYWRHVAGPLLAPAFFGSLLLLFANSFSAYATAAALINQGGIIVPLQIANTLTSEVILGQENFAKALALGMVVIVVVVMTLYVVLQRRTREVVAVTAASAAAASLPASTTAPVPGGRGVNARARRRLNIFRSVVLVLLGGFFLLPLFSMFEFTTRGATDAAPRSLQAWRDIVTYPELITAIVTSLELAIITSVASMLSCWCRR